MERGGEIELFHLNKKVLTHLSYCQVIKSIKLLKNLLVALEINFKGY